MASSTEGILKVFTGTANRELAERIAAYLGTTLSPAQVTRYNDGEIKVQIQTNVRGCDVFIIQPTSPPVNDNVMELLVLIDAARRASAKRITVVLPYYGYGRQDRRMLSRQPISAKLVADMITTAGPHHIVTLELASSNIQGFFNLPVDNLKADPVVLNYLKHALAFCSASSSAYLGIHREKTDILKSCVIVSPDAGNTRRATRLSERLGGTVKFAIIDKRKEIDGTESLEVVGDLADNAIIVKDMIDSGRSVCQCAEMLTKSGVKNVLVVATHGVFSGEALDSILKAPISEVITTDSIKQSDPVRQCSKATVLSVSSLLGEAIRRTHNGESVSSLFRLVGE